MEAIRVPSAVMKRDIPTTVVLPAAVARNPARRCPILYLPHGAGDNERGWLDRTRYARWQTRTAKSLMDDAIDPTPAGYQI